jgi:hypothetical protein
LIDGKRAAVGKHGARHPLGVAVTSATGFSDVSGVDGGARIGGAENPVHAMTVDTGRHTGVAGPERFPVLAGPILILLVGSDVRFETLHERRV